MKVIYNLGKPDVVKVELTRRNLQVLLEKLDDPESHRTISMSINNYMSVFVKAVEDHEHYQDRVPGAMYMPSKGEYV